MKVKSLSRVQLLAIPWTVAYQAPPSMDFPGKSAGVDRHFLLQGIFPTQESNPGLLHCGQPLYCLSHQGSPRQTLTDIKGEIDSNTIIVGDFITPLTPMDRSSKQKINKETQP